MIAVSGAPGTEQGHQKDSRPVPWLSERTCHCTHIAQADTRPSGKGWVVMLSSRKAIESFFWIGASARLS